MTEEAILLHTKRCRAVRVKCRKQTKAAVIGWSPEAGRTYAGPTGRCWGSGSLGKAPVACPSDSKLSECSSPDLDEQKERNDKAADTRDQHRVDCRSIYLLCKIWVS